MGAGNCSGVTGLSLQAVINNTKAKMPRTRKRFIILYFLKRCKNTLFLFIKVRIS
jgi:hypothetical protein